MADQPSRAKTMWRGLTLRCARCGSGGIVKRVVHLVPDCPKCGLHFEREQGYWTGALAIHFILTGGLVLTSLAVILIFTIPTVPVAPTIITLTALVLIGGTLFYPLSKTLWIAIDRAFMQRLDASEVPDEQIGN